MISQSLEKKIKDSEAIAVIIVLASAGWVINGYLHITGESTLTFIGSYIIRVLAELSYDK